MKLFNTVCKTLFCLLVIGVIHYQIQPANGIPESKIPTIHPSVVKVGRGCSGSITMINVVLTAAHCVDSASPVVVTFYNQKIALFTPLYVGKPSTITDFAILQGDTGDLPSFQLALKMPGFLTGMYHFGYNHTPFQWMTPSLYLGKLGLKEDSGYYLASQIIPGDSGGAVVGEADNLVYGIAYASYWPVKIGLAYIVPATEIQKVLKTLPL